MLVTSCLSRQLYEICMYFSNEIELFVLIDGFREQEQNSRQTNKNRGVYVVSMLPMCMLLQQKHA